jgi:hypothetical protein
MEYSRNSYVGVNAALRHEDVTHEDFIFWQPFIEALSTGLAGLPNWVAGDDARLFRSMMKFEGFDDIYVLNKVVGELAYTSTSKVEIRFPGDVIFRVAGLTGKDISHFALYREEEEVLFDFDLRHLLHKLEVPPVVPKELMTTDQWLPNQSGARFLHL